MKNNSVRFKISVLYTCILGIILVFFSIYPIITTQKILQREQEDALSVKAKQIDNYIDVYTIASQKDESAAKLLNQLFRGEIVNDRKMVALLWEKNTQSWGLEKDCYRIRNSKGEEVLRSKNFGPDAEKEFNARFGSSVETTHFASLKINHVPYYGINYQITFSGMNTLNLQLAMPVAYSQKILHDMVLSFTFGILIILFAGTFIAKYLTNKILKPVQEVARTAKEITQKNLNQRISIEEYDQEIKELVESFNEMIGRLGNSFAYINEFNSSVSHEMKTPLAIIKGELELALDKSGSKQENEQIMKDVLDEIYKLIRLIKDMLLLAEYEYKPDLFKMEKLDLIQFLKEIVGHFKVLADEKNIEFNLEVRHEPIWVNADPTHLRRVFFNLIHNAVKFTPVNGQISILAEINGKKVTISIKDSGIGIAPQNQARIFERFYRIHPPGPKTLEGNGLGLSLARAITRAHQGDITFESVMNKGSIFKVSLPLILH